MQKPDATSTLDWSRTVAAFNPDCAPNDHDIEYARRKSRRTEPAPARLTLGTLFAPSFNRVGSDALYRAIMMLRQRVPTACYEFKHRRLR
jgi:hypothetical protein